MLLADDGFKVPSPRATEAVKCGSALIIWCSQDAHKKSLDTFSNWLINALGTCFKPCRSLRLRREKMWSAYHKLRIDDSFTKEWERFIRASIDQKALPTFFQYVSNQVFRQVVEQKYAISKSSNEDQPIQITWEEENALRYVTGYVCRKVLNSIQSSSLPDKEDLVLFMIELGGDEMDEERGTETWTNLIDRGGLWHVNDNTYLIFYIMEEEIRHHFKVKSISKLNEETKRSILDAMLANEDLLFQWSLMIEAAEADDSTGMAVLNRIATLYLTVRGFAFASTCMELYKQRHKKQIQKSKALRKKVQTPDDEHI